MDYGKVAVLMGGLSAEREVSLKSGKAVHEALLRQGIDAHDIDADRQVLNKLREDNYDRAFITLHGRWGEDGVIQGALEVLGISYTGSGVLASALCMDKLQCKYLWAGKGVMSPEFVELTDGIPLQDVAAGLGFPMFIKPACEGSSIGMSRADNLSQLETAFALARKYDDRVFAESCIEGMELTAAIVGKEDLPLIKIETPRDYYDFEAKYSATDTRYICPCGLPDAEEQRIQELARHIYQDLGCSGWGRVDFMRDDAGNNYVLEVNTIPGLTDHSLVPMAAKAAGIGFDELVVRILEESHDS